MTYRATAIDGKALHIIHSSDVGNRAGSKQVERVGVLLQQLTQRVKATHCCNLYCLLWQGRQLVQLSNSVFPGSLVPHAAGSWGDGLYQAHSGVCLYV